MTTVRDEAAAVGATNHGNPGRTGQSFEKFDRGKVLQRSRPGQGEQDQAGIPGEVGEAADGGEEVEDGAEGARQVAQESVAVPAADGQTQK